MAMRWNWRKLGYGSGALVATLSTVFALSPSRDREQNYQSGQGIEVACQNDKPASAILAIQTKLVMNIERNQKLQDCIQKSRILCERVKDEKGLPGVTVAVSLNGRLVWEEGFGFANLENSVRMKPESIMRIASISKSFTMAMLAKLMEEGKVDIDKPIQTYLPNYPQKYVDEEKVAITTRHLLSHISGIRHYEKKGSDGNTNNPTDVNVQNKTTKKDASKKKKRSESADEMSLAEYFIKDKFASVEDALKLFQDDELFHKPGQLMNGDQIPLHNTWMDRSISHHRKAYRNTEFPKYSRRMFDYWGLKNTYLDIHEPIIYNRASYYTRMKDGVIINSPYVDNSYKWAGGGFLSTVGDLNQFANILLYSMQATESDLITCRNGLPKLPFLNRSTVKTVWTGNPVTARPEVPDLLYALGFVVGEPLRKCMFCKERNLMIVQHTGAAVGASSVLLMAFPIIKSDNCDNPSMTDEKDEVKGVVVSMITNLTSVSLTATATEIANIFREFI